MATRYDLENWQAPRDTELYRFGKHPTGMIVHCFGGWEWTTEDGETFRTNSEGEGLWACGPTGYHQVRGTCQFGLSQNRQKALRELRNYGLAPRRIGAPVVESNDDNDYPDYATEYIRKAKERRANG